jgi:glucan phosphoethanolaminetransferase (alkaline phosphatase superfamily)
MSDKSIIAIVVGVVFVICVYLICAARTKRRRTTARKKLLKFVDAIILLCLFMCMGITVYTLLEYHIQSALLGASELGVLMSFWGGELLLIVVRQVLGSDIKGKKKTTNEPEEDDT